ncbi:MAG: hypothetical protein IH814_00830 [Thaumarchaeota archaeon]|nr:hypothetical protein [Nitrososphaerota archaeon]
MVILNKEYLKLNKNLLISLAFSTIVSTSVAQILADQENYLNTTYTVIAGYSVFFSVFIIMFYIDFKHRYKLSSGQTNYGLLKKELFQLISSLGIGEIVYLAVRWTTLYYFLDLNYEPYIASLSSEAISTVCYLFVVTFSGKIVGLFKDSN